MTCKNCYGGYVRKFKGKRGKRKAIFYDEICPVCKGDWHKPEPLPEPPKPFNRELFIKEFKFPF